MEKLPVTSYIRLVDIWLIFGQIIPFMQVKTLSNYIFLLNQIEVVVFTIVQIYNENDFINHHGSERRVFNNKISGETKKENSFMLPQKNLGDIAKFFGK